MKGTRFVYPANARWGEKYAGQLATVTRNDYLHPDEPDIWLVALDGVERFSMNGSDVETIGYEPLRVSQESKSWSTLPPAFTPRCTASGMALWPKSAVDSWQSASGGARAGKES